MISGKRKKSAGMIAAVAAVAFFAAVPVSCSRNDTPESESRSAPTRSLPLVEQDATKVVPLEELDIAGKDWQELSVMGDRYFESRNYAQAAEVYKKVIELNPQAVDSYNDLGLAYHYTNRSALALDILKKGTTISPSYQRIWLSYGFVLLTTGRTDEAKTALNKVIELNPVNDVGQEAQRMLSKLQ